MITSYKKYNKKIVLLVIFGSLMTLAQVFLCIQLSGLGSKVYILERDATRLSDDNKRKSIEIMKLSSLKNIDDSSQNYGFVKPNKVLYLTGRGSSVAKLP